MESRHLAVLLKQTLDPTTQAEAAAELDKVSKIIGFAPGILQVIIFFWTLVCKLRQIGVLIRHLSRRKIAQGRVQSCEVVKLLVKLMAYFD